MLNRAWQNLTQGCRHPGLQVELLEAGVELLNPALLPVLGNPSLALQAVRGMQCSPRG